MAFAKIATVLLAAGAGKRFGGNKLEADLSGAMLGEHAARTLAGMKFGWCFAVHHPAYVRLAASIQVLGFDLIENIEPARGLSHSLKLAVEAAEATDADAVLVALADMPFVDEALLRSLVTGHHRYPDRCIASMSGAVPTPPAIFPRPCWGQLKSLSGDQGARGLLRDAILVQTETEKLRDIDTIEDVISASFR
jgi:molybdenum cofactor cytidylyltransferase